MSRVGMALAAGVLALAAPLGAQDRADSAGPPSEAEVTTMMQAAFKVEPLTAEQRARLPLAEAVIARMMPPGALHTMMGRSVDSFLRPFAALATGEIDRIALARDLGITEDELELDDDEVARLATILDPAWKQRRELETAAMQRGMTGTLSAMEPGMRKGMAEAYAATFSITELTDMERFFTTPSGKTFAAKSYALASDPRIMFAVLEGLPAMMEQMRTAEREARATQDSLPPRRSFAELTPADRAAIEQLTGMGDENLRQGMARAAAERAAGGAPGDGAQ